MIFTPEELDESSKLEEATLFKQPEKLDTVYENKKGDDRSFTTKF
jgi:hypothetical protein